MKKRTFCWSCVIAFATLLLPIAGLSAKEIAKVNGVAITDHDVEVALSGFGEGQRQQILKDTASRFQITETLIEQEIVYQQALKEKLEDSNEFKIALQNFKKQYLANLLLEKRISPKLTQDAVKKYYQANSARFSTTQVHAQHILLETEAQAWDMLKKAKEPSVDFQELAEKFSKDPSAKNNRGDLGFFGRDRMVPEFVDPVFATADGEIAGPIKTAYGFHVVKVIERKVGKTMEFDEVELQAKAGLKQSLIKDVVYQLKSQAKIERSAN